MRLINRTGRELTFIDEYGEKTTLPADEITAQVVWRPESIQFRLINIVDGVKIRTGKDRCFLVGVEQPDPKQGQDWVVVNRDVFDVARQKYGDHYNHLLTPSGEEVIDGQTIYRYLCIEVFIASNSEYFEYRLE